MTPPARKVPPLSSVPLAWAFVLQSSCKVPSKGASSHPRLET
jgi:hypothetical protein